MRKVHLDFETRSQVDIWKSGAWIYSTSPTTEVLCVAFAIDDSPVYLNDWFMLRQLAEDPGTLFVAHNAFFERSIWANILVPKFGFPPVPLKKWRDTMAKACAYGLPKSLEKASKAMGLIQGKDKAGRQIMLLMSKPKKITDKGEVVYDEKPENIEKLYEYCKQDVEVERELDTRLPDLSEREQEIWFYDQLINSRGVKVDMPTVKNILRVLESTTQELNQKLVQITGGKVTKGTEVRSMVNYLNSTGCRIPNLRKETVTEFIKSGRLNSHHIEVLKLRQELGKSSTAKYQRLLDSVDQNGVLRDCYIYHSASTGRWGGKLVQLQNLPYDKKGEIDVEKAINDVNTLGVEDVKKTYYGQVSRVFSACVRGVFVPSPGKELYVVDYGAIEARILMWMAQEKRGLKEFEDTDRGAEDIYVQMARRIYKRSDIKKGDKERALGKATILGCGYGMGSSKFVATCASNGIVLTEEEGSRIVNLYRDTYPKVRNYWYDMERAVMMVYHHPGTVQTAGNVRWVYQKSRDAIFCKLPSGRLLTYISPKIVPNKFDSESMSFMTEVNSQWVRRDLWGGTLVENVVQATARDVMAYSMPRLEKAGFPILMHTHDEIVSEQNKGAGRLQEMIDLMCVREPWLKGCPIVAEGFTCERYGKG